MDTKISPPYPKEEELLRYRDLFSKPQFEHFSKNRFMTKSPWYGRTATIRRMEIVDQSPKTRTKRDGVIIFDDTVNPKTGKKMEGVGWHHYNNPSRAMDAWYLCKKLVNEAKILGLNWVSCAKLNRKVECNGKWIKIKDLIKDITFDKEIKIGEDTYLCHSFILRLSKIGLVKLVLLRKKDPKTEEEKKVVPVVSDRLDWNESTILSKYFMRHRIEGFYRDSKQTLGLGKYMVREIDGVVRHLHLSFLAYTLLETIFIKGHNLFSPDVLIAMEPYVEAQPPSFSRNADSRDCRYFGPAACCSKNGGLAFGRPCPDNSGDKQKSTLVKKHQMGFKPNGFFLYWAIHASSSNESRSPAVPWPFWSASDNSSLILASDPKDSSWRTR